MFLIPEEDARAMSKRLRADLSPAIYSLLWGATFVVERARPCLVFIFLAACFSVALVL